MRIKIKAIVLVCFLLIPNSLHSQPPVQNQGEFLAAYSVGSGILLGGIGCYINAPKGKSRIQYFLNGALKGAIGGTFIYTGKRISSLISRKDEHLYAIPTRITHALGTTIIENTMQGKSTFSSFHMNIGFIKLSYSKNKSLKPKLMPFSFISTLFYAFQGHLDLKKSFVYGVPYIRSAIKSDNIEVAFASNNTMVFSNELEGQVLFLNSGHELAHILQFNEYLLFNNAFLKLSGNLSNFFEERNNFYKKWSKYIYWDINYYYLAYQLAGGARKPECYYNNFYEFEAQRYATWKNVRICK